jgi:hypothetical protein
LIFWGGGFEEQVISKIPENVMALSNFQQVSGFDSSLFKK